MREDFYREIAEGEGAAPTSREAAAPAGDPWPDAGQVEYRPPVGADPVKNPVSDTDPYNAGFEDLSINDTGPVPSYPQGTRPTGEGVNPAADTAPYDPPAPANPPLTAEQREAAIAELLKPPSFGRSDDVAFTAWGPSREGRIEYLNDPSAEATADGNWYDGDNPGADVGPYGGPRVQEEQKDVQAPPAPMPGRGASYSSFPACVRCGKVMDPIEALGSADVDEPTCVEHRGGLDPKGAADEPQGGARTINADDADPVSTCANCGQPVIQLQNGGWMHKDPGSSRTPTCGDPDPMPLGVTGQAPVPAAPPSSQEPSGSPRAVPTGTEEPERPEDERQRPYMPPALGAAWLDQSWYDGTAKSVRERILAGRQMEDHARQRGDFDSAERIAFEMDALERVVPEIERDYVGEHTSAVLDPITVVDEPGDLIEGGLLDLGPDDGSFLYEAARDIQHEVRGYDWDRFAVAGARAWLEERSRDSLPMLRRQVDTRQAAVEYAKVKTLPIMDAERRARIIDDFVSEVERDRRAMFAEVRTRQLLEEHSAASAEAARRAELGKVLDESGLLWTG